MMVSLSLHNQVIAVNNIVDDVHKQFILARFIH